MKVKMKFSLETNESEADERYLWDLEKDWHALLASDICIMADENKVIYAR